MHYKLPHYKTTSLSELLIILSGLIVSTLIIFGLFAVSRCCTKCGQLDAIRNAGEQELSRYHLSTYYKEQDRSYHKKYKVTYKKFKKCKYCDYSSSQNYTTTEDAGTSNFSVSSKIIVYFIVGLIWSFGFILSHPAQNTTKKATVKTEKKATSPKIKKEKKTLQSLYPMTQNNVISDKSLAKFSAEGLQIILNDIYARHGYIFKEGSKMDRYFKQKSWYVPKHKNVNNLLNKTEKTNILKIKKLLNKSVFEFRKTDNKINKLKR
ncbi:MAG: YARHG domain-containing protein [Flavobacteriaceae bacterium]|nr:YARHG domain-containing protein [Flavobacteriaceae bacterium]